MNTEITDHIEDLIIRSLCGDIDTKGKEELQLWISESADNEKYFLDRQEIWFSSTDAESLAQYDKDTAFRLFMEKVKSSKDNGRSHRKAAIKWIRYAAAVIAIFATSYFSYKNGQDMLRSEFTDITVTTPFGSRTKMTLPDGSTVWLNAGSQITYSQGFGVKERTVEINGEGYFEVAKNEKLPFSVKSGCMNITVLGTKFNICDYPEDNEAIVVLAEGKIALDNLMLHKEHYVMTPGQGAILDKNTGKMKIETCNANTAKQWTSGMLIFDGDPLPVIAKRLERSYNIKVSIADKALYSYRFYGDFMRQEQTLREVLETISATGKLKYRMDGNSVILYK